MKGVKTTSASFGQAYAKTWSGPKGLMVLHTKRCSICTGPIEKFKPGRRLCNWCRSGGDRTFLSRLEKTMEVCK